MMMSGNDCWDKIINPTCLNSFRIKSTQSIGRSLCRREH